MGCTVRDKHVRGNRKARQSKPEMKPSDLSDEAAISKSVLESGLAKPSKDSSPQNPSSGYDESAWGYCTEEQLEEILMKNLEYLYSEAISRLVSLGYDEDVALKAILRNGHCYGGMDVLTNILLNSLEYLNSNNGSRSSEESEPVFEDLRQLEGYSLAGMVRLLQQFRPHLSNGDAMWCLLMSDLHVGRASTMEIPVLPLEGNGSASAVASSGGGGGGDSQGFGGDISPSLCRFHSGWGFGNGGCCDSQAHGYSSNGGGDAALQREVECPERFNLSPAMKTLLKKNVALFAAGFRANMKQSLPQGESSLNFPPVGTSQVGLGTDALDGKGINDPKNQDLVNSMLSKFRNLNLDESAKCVAEDQKDEMILSLLRQIKELEKQAKERKEWAQQKAMQAATKLSNDLRELKMLRMEREETQKVKKGKQTLEDATMKRLSEMENSLRKASGQVDRANASVKRLENENAEIRAEMEACKLSTAESISACSEVAKREKKSLKRLLAWEKQRAKLQEEIDEEREKIAQVKQNIAHVNQCKKDTEAKMRQEANAKEQAVAQLEEERRLKDLALSSSKRRLESLRMKTDIDFQRHKDDIQRLEQDLSRLKTSNDSNRQSPFPGGGGGGETIARMLRELDDLEDSPDRLCIVCLKDEISVVFLPCAHQLMCAGCGDSYGSKGKANCPSCRVPIDEKIRVYGASS